MESKRIIEKDKQKIVEVVGWTGTALILIAYFLVSFELIEPGSATFQLLNLSGAFGILIISLYKKVYQTVVTNTFWMIIAIVALIQIILK